MTAELSNIYRDVIGFEPKPTVLEGLLLSAYEGYAGENYLSDLDAFLKENSFIPEQIRAHVAEQNPIFLQPSVLLVYLAVRRSVRRAISAWPLTEREIEPLLNDLGESTN
jgi:hypothetical protein